MKAFLIMSVSCLIIALTLFIGNCIRIVENNEIQGSIKCVDGFVVVELVYEEDDFTKSIKSIPIKRSQNPVKCEFTDNDLYFYLGEE